MFKINIGLNDKISNPLLYFVPAVLIEIVHNNKLNFILFRFLTVTKHFFFGENLPEIDINIYK